MNELIDHIEVYHAETGNGQRMQHLTIHYNCIGSIAIPETLQIPKVDVSINTCKGVNLTYNPREETKTPLLVAV